MLRSFSVFSPDGLFVRRPSFPFRFRPSLPGLLFRIVVSLVFGQPVGAPSFPCLPGFHLNIYEVFSCVASCASSVLSLCVPSVPVSSPFCNPCRPSHFSVPIRPVVPLRLPYFPCVCLCSCAFSFLQSLQPPPFFRSNSFRCSGASSMLSLLCVLCPVVFVFLVSEPPPLLQPLPIPFISPLCTPPDTYPALSLCVFCPGTSSSLSSFLPFLSPSLGFPFPLCVFSASLPPPSLCHSPFSPPPFPLLPPSFPRFPSPFLLFFCLLLLPFRKKVTP